MQLPEALIAHVLPRRLLGTALLCTGIPNNVKISVLAKGLSTTDVHFWTKITFDQID